jgi:hypothetical protein
MLKVACVSFCGDEASKYSYVTDLITSMLKNEKGQGLVSTRHRSGRVYKSFYQTTSVFDEYYSVKMIVYVFHPVPLI